MNIMKTWKNALPVLACVVTTAMIAAPARSEICSIDHVPAATLLVPHFKVDLEQCDTGVTTIVHVRNASADSTAAQVNLWTNLDRPVVGFPIYLDPYDTVIVNIGEVVCNGAIPITNGFVEPEPNIGNAPTPIGTQCPGPFSPGAFASQIDPEFLADIQAHLTGQPAPSSGLTRGLDMGDNVARGYATVDVVNECTSLLPGEPGYFSGGVVAHDNVLLGEFRIADPANNFSQGEAAISIESAPEGVFTGGETTFYGRFTTPAMTGLDRREPLPGTFMMRRKDDSMQDSATDVIVWREGNGEISSFPPGFLPRPYPLNAFQIEQFDDESNPVIPPPPLPGEPIEEPVVPNISSQMRHSFEMGHGAESPEGLLFMNLASDADPFNDANNGQAWVMKVGSSEGRFSSGHSVYALDSTCAQGKTLTVSSSGALAANPDDPDHLFTNGFER